MAKPTERLVQWLRDAHAMEEQAAMMLSGTAKRLEHYPQLKARIEEHIAETQRQGERIAACIERLDGGTSSLKDAAGKMVGLGQAISGLFTGDEVVKAALAGYAFEHMEIASYRILIAAAEVAGDRQTKQVCEQNLAEEEAMAEWLKNNIADVTQTYLRLDADPDAMAKR